MKRSVFALLVGFVAFGFCLPAMAQKATTESPDIIGRLAKDPLIAWSANSQDLAATWDEIIGTIRRFLPEADRAGFDEGLAEMDQKLGLSLRDDLLALIGPDIGGTLDLPPVDSVVGMFMVDPAEGTQGAVGGIGIVTRVRNRERLNRTLHHLIELAGAELQQEAELMVLTIHPEPSEPEMELRAYYGFKGDHLAFGFSPDWVRTALKGHPAGQQLGEGADYREVMAALDAEPEIMMYINLPKLQEMLRSSQMLQAGLQSEPEAAQIAEVLLDPTFARTGVGYTAVRVGNGVRRTTFGPAWLGGAMQIGMIAAIAIPNMQNAVERGRQKRTMADMRSLATAMEAFAIDNNEYPTTEGAWQDVSVLEDLLSPVYFNEMPTSDGWGHPFQVWSNGVDYWIVSPGRDGEVWTDWSTVTEVEIISSPDDDIAYSNGAFMTEMPN
jgi:general secretion pathway protein G